MSIIKEHSRFVDGVTSEDSKNNEAWFTRLRELDNNGVDIARLTTAAIGLGGEGGEVMDLVKKVLFHGKPWSDDIRKKLIDEASDIASKYNIRSVPTVVIESNGKELHRFTGAAAKMTYVNAINESLK